MTVHERNMWMGVAVMAALVLAAPLAAWQAPVTASDAWVVEPALGASAASAYVTIENPSMYEIYVVSVTTEAAGSAEMVDGPADAPKAVSELAVPAYGSTELKPGGLHIRLKDLKKPLSSGDSVPLTLTTDGGVVIKVMAAVKKGG